MIRPATAKDASRIAEIIVTNYRGIAFYKRHGFELTGEKITEDECVPLVKLTRKI